MRSPLLRLLWLLPCFALFTGMAQKPDFIVRFFVEANERDSDRFATPIELKYPPRKAFVERVPVVSERNIKSVFPYQGSDGSWGCAFKLDPSGRLALEAASTENRGRSIVAFVGTKKGTHQVIDMIIDRPISDGVITIQRGLTTLELAAITKAFPDARTGKKRVDPKPSDPSVRDARETRLGGQ